MTDRRLAQQNSPYPIETADSGPPPTNVAFVENGGASEGELSLRDILTVLRRRKAIFLQTFILIVAVGVVVTMATKPLYRSTSRILVEGQSTTVSLSNTDDPLSRLFLPPAGHMVDTQVEVLRSQSLLNKAYKVAKFKPSDVYTEVRQFAETDVIEIAATSDSRDKAQKFAQILPQVYLASVKNESMREVTTALNYARNRHKETKARLILAEAALERFKTDAGVVNVDAERANDINAAGTATLTAQQAEADAASAAARLATLEAGRSRLPETIVTPVETTNNAQIEDLKKQLADLNSERKKVLFLYEEGDDEVKKVDSQIADMQRRLAAVPQTTTTVSRAPNPEIAPYEAKLAEARAAHASAQANLAATRAGAAVAKRSLDRYNPIERSASQLQRDIDSDKESVLMLAKSVEQLSLREKAAAAAAEPVKVIASASRAEQIAPRVTRNIILSVLLGLVLGCMAAMLQNTLDDHIGDEDEARQMLGTQILGHSPRLAQEKMLLSVSDSDPQLLERFRVLRSNVQFSLFNRPSRSLLVTSTSPGEGKTSTASNLAIAMALDKRRVILVDADLRRPRLHEVFNLEAQPGLTNVLVGQVALEDALRETHVPGLRVLASGALPPNSAELLNSPAMDALFRDLEEVCDVVILDTPPTLATADAQVLAAKVDGVVYVMELGKAHKSAVQRSFELLHQARANIIGIVFNKVEKGGDRHYSYDYYGEYVYAADDDGDDDVAGNGSKGKRKRRSGQDDASLKAIDWTQVGSERNGSATAGVASNEIKEDEKNV